MHKLFKGLVVVGLGIFAVSLVLKLVSALIWPALIFGGIGVVGYLCLGGGGGDDNSDK